MPTGAVSRPGTLLAWWGPSQEPNFGNFWKIILYADSANVDPKPYHFVINLINCLTGLPKPDACGINLRHSIIKGLTRLPQKFQF